MSKQVRKKEVVLSCSTEEGEQDASTSSPTITFSLRLETRTTAPGVAAPGAPELELASATIAARRFASAD